MPPAQPRLAPTHKISDDAPLAPPTAAPAPPPGGPVSYAPPSIPPATAAAPPGVIATPPPGSLVRPASQPSPYAARPASEPPARSLAPRQPPAPQLSSTSGSLLVPARRPVGLIALVLIVDLGLAAAGATLLVKGLATRHAAPSETTGGPPAEQATERKSEAPAAAALDGVATTSGPSTGAIAIAADRRAAAREAPIEGVTRDPAAARAPAIAATRASTASSDRPRASTARTSATMKAATTATTNAATTNSATTATTNSATTATTNSATTASVAAAMPARDSRRTSDPTAAATGSSTSSGGGGAARVGSVPAAPQDPYPDPKREVDAAAARSTPVFARCAADHGPARGAIQIAFQVRPDGQIANAAAVENSTGNAELARCLVAEIASWRVSAHGGATLDMFRPFTYP